MRKWYKRNFESLQNAIIVMVAVLILIPTMILGVISYYQYRKIVIENSFILNQKNTSQIASNIEGIMSNLKNTSLSFFQNDIVRDFLLGGSEEEIDDARTALNQYIRNQLCYEEYIYAVEFERMDGQIYSSSSITDGIDEELRQELLKKNGRALFLTNSVSGGEVRKNEEELYGYARCINDINNIGTPIGFEKIYIKKSVIMRLISDGLVEDEAYYITDDEQIRISSDPEAQGKIIHDYFPELDLQEKNKKGNLVYTKIPSPNWYIVKKISSSQTEKDAYVVRQLLAATGILAVVICAFMGFFMAHFVIRPLKELETSMRHLEEDDFKRKLPETGYREIVILVRAFNRMADRLDELVNRVYRAEIREKDAQIRAMQAYINPHFLYNTLDTICWMSRMEQAFETCSLIEALSNLFRSSVKNTSKTVIVEEEMNQIDSYIKIQECRHTDTIEFEICMAPEIRNCETVRFVLQPLVENAIVHGMEEKEISGTIKIRGEKRGEELVLSVEDEGQGCDLDDLNQILEGKVEGTRGVALLNVHERVKLCFGPSYGLCFKKSAKGGLLVEVIQPFRKKGEAE